MRKTTLKYDAGKEREALARILAAWTGSGWLDGRQAARFCARSARLAKATRMSKAQVEAELRQDAMAILATDDE